ncbi:hypothetical protein H4R34_000810 [Dimargaris verticillata]|uniref:Uncharacterized protein n=1 Tax=Dimargaris verticillata TaxID=2761393 RepID=A0A9W8BB54_9FUNG|nr:hypothetical protein H4R34_000810 [Dimargaris verticillata]
MQRVSISALLVISAASLAYSTSVENYDDLYSNPWQPPASSQQAQHLSITTPYTGPPDQSYDSAGISNAQLDGYSVYGSDYVTSPGSMVKYPEYTATMQQPPTTYTKHRVQRKPVKSTLVYDPQSDHFTRQPPQAARVASGYSSAGAPDVTDMGPVSPSGQLFTMDSWDTYCRSFDSGIFLTGASEPDIQGSTSRKFRFQKGLQSMASVVKNTVNPDVEVQLNNLFQSAFNRYKNNKPVSLWDVQKPLHGRQLWGMIIRGDMIRFTQFQSLEEALQSKDYQNTFAYFTLDPTPVMNSMHKKILYCTFMTNPALTVQSVLGLLGDATTRPTALRRLSGDFKSWLGGKSQQNVNNPAL